MAPATRAQSTNAQIWLEYMLNYPFANSFNVENAFVYNALIGTPRWQSLEYSPTVDYSLTQNLDFCAGGTLAYTEQTDSYNTFEARVMIGSRLHLTPHRRVQLRIYGRLEFRNFLNLDTHEWEHVPRPRIRVESLIPINKKSYWEDHLWYGIADVEWLFTDEDVEERFANRFRLRLGVGYRLSYTSRFEFVYTAQKSRSGIDEDFTSSDHIFRFRYKHYLRKTKPTKSSGSGN